MTSRAQAPVGPPRLAIIEPNHSGHRLWYVRLVALEARSQCAEGVDVISTEAAAASMEWATHLDELSGLRLHVIPESRGWKRKAMCLAREIGAEVTVIPDGDTWLWPILRASSLGSGRTSLLLMRPQAQPGPGGCLRWRTKRLLASFAQRRARVHVFALSMTEGSQSPSGALLGIPTIPDPVTPSTSSPIAARHILGIRENEALTLTIGALTRRKGMPSLLSAWEIVDSPDARLALVGRLADDVRCQVMELASRDPRVTVVDRYVPDSEVDRWVAAADRIVALYDNVGSSGIALRAWADGKPLLVWAGGSLQASLSSLGATHIQIPQENWLAVLASEIAAPRVPDSETAPRMSADVLRERTRRFSEGLIGYTGEAQRGEVG